MGGGAPRERGRASSSDAVARSGADPTPHRISLRHPALLCGVAIAPLRISLRLRLGFCDSPSRGE